MDVILQERLVTAVETIANSIVNVESNVMDIHSEIQNSMNNMYLNLCDIRNVLGYTYDSCNMNTNLADIGMNITNIGGDIITMSTQLQNNNEVILKLIKKIEEKGVWL